MPSYSGDIMRNVTSGFKDYMNIEVYAMSEIGGVRFMLTNSEGGDESSPDIDIMYSNARYYQVPAPPSMYSVLGDPSHWDYVITDEDKEARPLTYEEVLGVEQYLIDNNAENIACLRKFLSCIRLLKRRF